MSKNEDLMKKVEEQRAKQKQGWEIASYGVENKDLGAMRNALDLIATAKVKEQTYIDIWFDGKYFNDKD